MMNNSHIPFCVDHIFLPHSVTSAHAYLHRSKCRRQTRVSSRLPDLVPTPGTPHLRNSSVYAPSVNSISLRRLHPTSFSLSIFNLTISDPLTFLQRWVRFSFHHSPSTSCMSWHGTNFTTTYFSPHLWGDESIISNHSVLVLRDT